MHTVQRESVVEEQPVVYLAGPINNTDNGGTEWRKQIKSCCINENIVFTDPTDNINVVGDELTITEEPEDENEVSPAEIVGEDKEMLRKSDIVLVGYSDVKSVGTPMEVQWAYSRNYYIFMWIRDETDIVDLSPWYRYHCDYISQDVDDVLNQLLTLAD